MGKDKAPEKGEGEVMPGRVNPTTGEADFPAVIDRLGKLVVPGYVREMLGFSNKKVRVQVSLQLKEVFVEKVKKEEEKDEI